MLLLKVKVLSLSQELVFTVHFCSAAIHTPPSPDPLPDPSPTISREDKEAIKRDIENCEDGFTVMSVLAIFVHRSEEIKSEILSLFPEPDRERISVLIIEAQKLVKPESRCMLRTFGGTEAAPQYVWKPATLISKPQLPGKRFWDFRLDDGSTKAIHVADDGGSDEWLFIGE